MPRATKCRRVCAEPDYKLFKSEAAYGHKIILCVEELESIRLIDFEGLEQGEAAERMGISRGTFQRILYEARHKVAEALVTGASIVIEGGNYSESSSACNTSKRCKCCRFHKERYKKEVMKSK